eukprot:10091730-Alexandrium_andersonii.AAC.1
MGPAVVGREEAQGQGALGLRGYDLPLAAGEGRAVPARVPDDRELPGEERAGALRARPEVQCGVGHVR